MPYLHHDIQGIENMKRLSKSKVNGFLEVGEPRVRKVPISLSI